MIPARGDVFIAPLTFSDQVGSKRRPVCVVSDEGLSSSEGDVVVAMVTAVRCALSDQAKVTSCLRIGRRRGCFSVPLSEHQSSSLCSRVFCSQSSASCPSATLDEWTRLFGRFSVCR